MEFKAMKEAVTIYDTVQTASAEYPIECDFILPDYCDDVARILKCTATALITDKSMAGDRLQVEGSIFIKIIYVGESGGLRCASNKMPFSKAFDIKIPMEQHFIRVEAMTDYVNCRLINQRRVDVRGAISLTAKVSVSRPHEIITDASGCGVQMRKCPVNVGKIVSEVSKQFTVREDLEITRTNFAIQDVVMSRSYAKVTDYKVISNKVIVKGQLNVITTAADNGNGVETLEHAIPISQIIDMDGVDEDCMCHIRFDVMNNDITLVNELDDKVLAAVILMNVTVRAHKQEKLKIVSDVYSTDFDLLVSAEPMLMQQVEAVVSEDFSVKFRFQIPPEEIEKVADTWCEVRQVGVMSEGNSVMVKAKANISLLGYNSAGEIIYLERTEAIDYKRDVSGDFESLVAEFTASAASASYSMESDSTMELRLQVAMDGFIYGNVKRNAVIDISPQQDKPKKREEEASLTIYYADAGEDVWDIAKKYNTSPEKIAEENGMDDPEIGSRMMLLIPAAD